MIWLHASPRLLSDLFFRRKDARISTPSSLSDCLASSSCLRLLASFNTLKRDIINRLEGLGFEDSGAGRF